MKHKGYNNAPIGPDHKYGYNGKEENDELGLNWIDYGARNYDASLGRWMNIDPLAEIYNTDTPYAYVLNNPLSFIDPDGRQVIGVTKRDAEITHNSLKFVFADEKFDKLRVLFTRGKKNKSKTFDKIDKDAAKEALSGLDDPDDLALAELVIGAINSGAEHFVEHVEDDDDVSSAGSNAFIENFKNTGTDIGAKLNENGRKKGREILNIASDNNEGLNIPIKNGSHSILSESRSNPFVLFHEVFGHGIPASKNILGVLNHTNAIRTENLVYRVLGRDKDQRSGKSHTGGSEIKRPKDLPQIKN